MPEQWESAPSTGAERQSLWKVNDVAHFLKMAPQSIYRIVSENRIPFIKIGGALRFDQEEIRRWIHQKRGRSRKPRVS